ncbi:hypothetical protein K504DRAFT_464874 [Pleomassaria siparia CBS 279.74]|uniref:C3H1-type domain-containing protein n=1 Tax=Pleomassaria siparia CBS 279.74 TaxID=1314801 RepID=A0A6G1KJ72_9PLEO|nr:hypothetical protein K504DRAFT_464874 [Pleomassaria siparia CBS 279.74]
MSTPYDRNKPPPPPHSTAPPQSRFGTEDPFAEEEVYSDISDISTKGDQALFVRNNPPLTPHSLPAHQTQHGERNKGMTENGDCAAESLRVHPSRMSLVEPRSKATEPRPEMRSAINMDALANRESHHHTSQSLTPHGDSYRPYYGTAARREDRVFSARANNVTDRRNARIRAFGDIPRTVYDLRAYYQFLKVQIGENVISRFKNGDGRVNPSQYGGTHEYDLGLCFTTFLSTYTCEKRDKCPWRHHPLTEEEKVWVKRLGSCEEFLRKAEALWAKPCTPMPGKNMADVAGDGDSPTVGGSVSGQEDEREKRYDTSRVVKRPREEYSCSGYEDTWRRDLYNNRNDGSRSSRRRREDDSQRDREDSRDDGQYNDRSRNGGSGSSKRQHRTDSNHEEDYSSGSNYNPETARGIQPPSPHCHVRGHERGQTWREEREHKTRK